MKIGPQLSHDDLILTRRIANLRIHVERAIGTYRILNDIPMAPLIAGLGISPIGGTSVAPVAKAFNKFITIIKVH